MLKNIFGWLVLIFVVAIVTQNIFSGNSGDELNLLRQQAHEAEVGLLQASKDLREVADRYELVVDSLEQKGDSLNTVAVEARARASAAARSYNDHADQLIDSLMKAGEESISEEIIYLRASHDSVVVALNDEIRALKADRALLWRRVEMSDSIINLQDMKIQASLAVSEALTNERDAWRAKANPSLPKRLYQSAPFMLAAVVIVSVVKEDTP